MFAPLETMRACQKNVNSYGQNWKIILILYIGYHMAWYTKIIGLSKSNHLVIYYSIIQTNMELNKTKTSLQSFLVLISLNVTNQESSVLGSSNSQPSHCSPICLGNVLHHFDMLMESFILLFTNITKIFYEAV